MMESVGSQGPLSSSKVLRSVSLADVTGMEDEISNTHHSHSALIAAVKIGRSPDKPNRMDPPPSSTDVNAQPQDFVISDGKVMRVKKVSKHRSFNLGVDSSMIDSLGEVIGSTVWGMRSPAPVGAIKTPYTRSQQQQRQGSDTLAGPHSQRSPRAPNTCSSGAPLRSSADELRMLRHQVEELQAQLVLRDRKIQDLERENLSLRGIDTQSSGAYPCYPSHQFQQHLSLHPLSIGDDPSAAIAAAGNGADTPYCDADGLSYVTPKSFAATPNEHVSYMSAGAIVGAGAGGNPGRVRGRFFSSPIDEAGPPQGAAAPVHTGGMVGGGGRERCGSASSVQSEASSVTATSASAASHAHLPCLSLAAVVEETERQRERRILEQGQGQGQGQGQKLQGKRQGQERCAILVPGVDVTDLDQDSLGDALTPGSAGFYSVDTSAPTAQERKMAHNAGGTGPTGSVLVSDEQSVTSKGSVLTLASGGTSNSARKRLPPHALAARLALGSTERRKLSTSNNNNSSSSAAVGKRGSVGDRARAQARQGSSGGAEQPFQPSTSSPSPLSLPGGTHQGSGSISVGGGDDSDSLPSVQSNLEAGAAATGRPQLVRSTSFLARRLMNARSHSNSSAAAAAAGAGATGCEEAVDSPLTAPSPSSGIQPTTPSNAGAVAFRWVEDKKAQQAAGKPGVYLFIAHDNPQLGNSVATIMRNGASGCSRGSSRASAQSNSGSSSRPVECMLECKDDQSPPRSLFLLGTIVYSGDFARVEAAEMQQPRGSACIVVTQLRAVLGDIKQLATDLRNDIIEIDLDPEHVPQGFAVPIRCDEDLREVLKPIKSRVDVILDPYHTEHRWYPYWEGRRRMAPQFRSKGIGYLRLGDDMSEYGTAFISLDAGASYLDGGASAAVSGRGFLTRESPFRASHNSQHLAQLTANADFACDGLNDTLSASLKKMHSLHAVPSATITTSTTNTSTTSTATTSSSSTRLSAGLVTSNPLHLLNAGLDNDAAQHCGAAVLASVSSSPGGVPGAGTPRRVKSMRIDPELMEQRGIAHTSSSPGTATTAGASGSGTSSRSRARSNSGNSTTDSGSSSAENKKGDLENMPLLSNGRRCAESSVDPKIPAPMLNFKGPSPGGVKSAQSGGAAVEEAEEPVVRIDLEAVVQDVRAALHTLKNGAGPGPGAAAALKWSDRADTLNSLARTLQGVASLELPRAQQRTQPKRHAAQLQQLATFVAAQAQLLSETFTLLADTLAKQKNPHVLAASVECARALTFGALLSQHCWLPWRSLLLECVHLLRSSNKLVSESAFVCLIELYLYGAYSLALLCGNSSGGNSNSGGGGGASASGYMAEMISGIRGSSGTGARPGSNSTSGAGVARSQAASQRGARRGAAKLSTAANTSKVLSWLSAVVQKSLEQQVVLACLRAQMQAAESPSAAAAALSAIDAQLHDELPVSHADLAALLTFSQPLLAHREEGTREATCQLWATVLVFDIIKQASADASALLALSGQISDELATASLSATSSSSSPPSLPGSSGSSANGSNEVDGKSSADAAQSRSGSVFGRSLSADVWTRLAELRSDPDAPRAHEKVVAAAVQLLSRYALNAVLQVASFSQQQQQQQQQQQGQEQEVTPARHQGQDSECPTAIVPSEELSAIKQTVGLLRAGSGKSRSRSRRPSLNAAATITAPTAAATHDTDMSTITGEMSTATGAAGSSSSRSSPRAPHRPPLSPRGGRAAGANATSHDACAAATAAAASDGGEGQLSSMWFEAKSLLRTIPSTEADWKMLSKGLSKAPSFFSSLSALARAVGMPRGLLLRHVLPFDEHTSSADQAQGRATGGSLAVGGDAAVLPEAVRGRGEELAVLATQAAALRSLIRVKMADAADLDQAKEAVRILTTFGAAVEASAASTHRSACQILKALDT